MQKFDTTGEARKRGYTLTLTEALDLLNKQGIEVPSSDPGDSETVTKHNWLLSAELKRDTDEGRCKGCLVGSHYLYNTSDLAVYRKSKCAKPNIAKRSENYHKECDKYDAAQLHDFDRYYRSIPTEFNDLKKECSGYLEGILKGYNLMNRYVGDIIEETVKFDWEKNQGPLNHWEGDGISPYQMKIEQALESAKRGQVPYCMGEPETKEDQKLLSDASAVRCEKALNLMKEIGKSDLFDRYQASKQKLDYIKSHKKEYEEMNARKAEQERKENSPVNRLLKALKTK